MTAMTVVSLPNGLAGLRAVDCERGPDHEGEDTDERRGDRYGVFTSDETEGHGASSSACASAAGGPATSYSRKANAPVTISRQAAAAPMDDSSISRPKLPEV